MEAKDTVMKTVTELEPYHFAERVEYDDITVNEEQWDIPKLLKAQAEISFKAGIKEVVEWVRDNIAFANDRYKRKWQAKLREWGIG